MNRLTSQQRKLVYLGGMILLLMPIIWLGRPGAPATKTQPADAGGELAQLRAKHDLAESALGQVDPTSATMNVVLLGLRGVAATILAQQLDHYKDTKNWAELEATTESIIQLQPHYQKVWQYHGWNMAYNVSVEWDDVRDRYRWVKRGIKFYMRGTEQNKKIPDLFWYTGDTIGKKIGRMDEWRQYRRFFRQDPDARWAVNGVPGPDTELNPEMKEDNYEVAKVWFTAANRVWDEYGIRQQIMANILFRGYPPRAQFDLAAARQREGKFDEITRRAWDEAFNDWTKKYGAEQFPTPAGPLHLEWTAEEITREIADPERSRAMISLLSNNQDVTNYRFWRSKGLAERDQSTLASHRELYEAIEALTEGDATTAEEKSFAGMQKFEETLDQFQDLKIDTQTVQEGLLGQLTWRAALQLRGKEVPETYPLKKLWLEEQDQVSEVQREFDSRLSGRN